MSACFPSRCLQFPKPEIPPSPYYSFLLKEASVPDTLWACHILGPTLPACLALAGAPQEKGGEPEPWIYPQPLFKGAAGPAVGSRHNGALDTASVAAAADGGCLASGSTACAPHLLLPDAGPEP